MRPQSQRVKENGTMVSIYPQVWSHSPRDYSLTVHPSVVSQSPDYSLILHQSVVSQSPVD